MCKTFYVILIGFLCITQVDAQKKRDKRGFDRMHILINADTDRDYKVDSSELRDWLEVAEDIFEAQRGMRLESIDISFIKDFDEDKNYELSSGEKRDLKDFMSERMDKTYKELLEEYDTNDNRRFDKDELVQLRTDIPNFMRYALRGPEKEEKQEQKEENFRREMPVEINERPRERMKDGGRFRDQQEEPKEAPKKKKKLDDIYD